MPGTLLFCDLDLQSQGHWWPLKAQILAIFSHFDPVLIYRRLDHGWYIIHICVLCNHAGSFLAFFEIFSHLALIILDGNY